MDAVAIFWDYENCPVPSNISGYIVVNNLRTLAQPYGSVRSLKAYLGLTEQLPMPKALAIRSELQSSGVSLVDCPHNGRKDVADKMIIVDMLAHAIDNPAPSTIILITGDRDFAYAMSILRLRRYRIILVTLPNAHSSLTAQASVCLNWNETVIPVPLDAPNIFEELLSSHQQEFPDSDTTLTSPRRPYKTLRTEFVHKRVDSVQPFIPVTPKKSVHSSHSHCTESDKQPNLQLQPYDEPPSWKIDRLPPIPFTPNGLPFQQPLPQNLFPYVRQNEDLRPHVDSPYPKQHESPTSGESVEVQSPCSSPEPDDPARNNVLNKAKPSTTPHDGTPQQSSQGISEGEVLSVPVHFKILVQCLQRYQLTGNFRPLRSVVALEVAKNGTYKKAGVEKFKQYVTMAQNLGIIDLGGTECNAWIYLMPKWKNAQ